MICVPHSRVRSLAPHRLVLQALIPIMECLSAAPRKLSLHAYALLDVKWTGQELPVVVDAS